MDVPRVRGSATELTWSWSRILTTSRGAMQNLFVVSVLGIRDGDGPLELLDCT